MLRNVHPGPGCPADAGHVRGDVLLRDAGADLDRPGSTATSCRTCRSRVALALTAARPRRADLLHPPHRDRHPAAAGHRQHRPRPGTGGRRRVRRGAGRSAGLAATGRRSPELLRARLDASGGVGGRPTQRLPAVRAARARWSRSPPRYDAVIRLHDRPGHFLVRGPPDGDRVAGRGRAARSAPAGAGAHHRAAADADPGHRVRHRPAGRDRDPRAVSGRERHRSRR